MKHIQTVLAKALLTEAIVEYEKEGMELEKNRYI